MRQIAMTLLLGLALGAGPHANAALALHLEAAGTGDLCYRARAVPGCMALDTETPLLGVPYFVHVLVEHADATAGVGGAGFGIWYPPSVNVLGWTLCADAETPSSGWPASAAGNLITWTPADCQHDYAPYGAPATHGLAHLGYFYMTAYAPSQVALIRHPVSHQAVVLDCAGGADDLATRIPGALGLAGLGGAPGYNPCPEPAQPYPCRIDGPSIVPAGTTGHVYTASDLGQCGLYAGWSVTGNATIEGPTDQSTVSVTATTPGAFTLEFRLTDIECGAWCTKTVTVEDAVPARPATWGIIKTLYGSR